MGLADQADDVLEVVMLRGTKMNGLVDAYLAREFSVFNRL